MRQICTWACLSLSLGLMACTVQEFEDCPDGFLRNNDGNCIQVGAENGEPKNPGEDTDTPDDIPSANDPLGASCEELGGNVLENDACVVTCTYDSDEPDRDRYDDCPGEVPCVPGWNVCAKNECETDADCMQGWSCFKGQFSACLMPCEYETQPCPNGWSCGGPDDWLIYGDDAYACLWAGYGS